MKSELKVEIESGLYERFEMALRLNDDDAEKVVETFLRSYVAKAFLRAAAYEEENNTEGEAPDDENYGKAIHRIPKWAKKPEQINHKIIRAFFQLEKDGMVDLRELQLRCTDRENYPDVYIPTFTSNFAQMKFDRSKSHGKVFEVEDDTKVRLWSVIEPTLIAFREDFMKHTTDMGYLNKNNQRNMGKTEERGTDYMQYLYKMKCEHCTHEYFANGSDIFQKKCPACQGGAETDRK